MNRPTVLHYVTQWMWLSDTFVAGPIAAGQHRAIVVSRMELVNAHVYPPPPECHTLSAAGDPPEEGTETADAVRTLLGPVQPDLLHLHHGYGLPDTAAIADALRRPLVVSFWGYDVTALPVKDPQRLGRHLAVPDIVLVPSQFLADRVSALGVQVEQIRVVPASVDTRYFLPTPMPLQPRVAFVGRFVPKKGIDTLMAAWPLVRRAVSDAQLTILGYGEAAPRPDAASGVFVLRPDPVDPRRQVREVIRQCRIYVSPSRTGPDGDSESQHVGNLEAQASGRAVLTTDHGAIPEFVRDQVDGVVVPQNDHRALAAAMIELLRDPTRCERLGQQATRAAWRLDVSRISKLHDQLYRQLSGKTEGSV
jgi:colanic acid/amylovoran biosynthesis glycosyltransferase